MQDRGTNQTARRPLAHGRSWIRKAERQLVPLHPERACRVSHTPTALRMSTDTAKSPGDGVLGITGTRQHTAAVHT